MQVALSLKKTGKGKRPATGNRKGRIKIEDANKSTPTMSSLHAELASLVRGIPQDLGRLEIIYPCY